MDGPTTDGIDPKRLAVWDAVQIVRSRPTPEVEPWEVLKTGTFVVYDTEYTSWSGSLARDWSRVGEFREVIQIGAAHVRVDGARLEIGQTLNVLVKPTANPVLSDHVTGVTGITQAQVDDGGLAPGDALQLFAEFLAGRSGIAYGNDHVILKETAVINGIPLSDDDDRFRSIRNTLPDALEVDRSLTSGEIGTAIGSPPETGAAHDAMYDVLSLIAGLQRCHQGAG